MVYIILGEVFFGLWSGIKFGFFVVNLHVMVNFLVTTPVFVVCVLDFSEDGICKKCFVCDRHIYREHNHFDGRK